MFEWEDFLELTEVLTAEPNNEAVARSDMSRVYYATFHTGWDHFVRSGYSRRNAHLQVQDELRNKSGIAGQVVKRHHVWRTYADYDALLIPDVARQAAVAVILAREAIDAIKAIS